LGVSIPAKAELTCPDAGLLSGKLLTDVCWSCIFPIRVAGLPLGSGNVPSGASNKSFCLCEDNLGVPRPGIVTSMWEPARLIELVRTPGCSPSLGGIRLPLGDRRLQGGHGEGEYDTGDLAFYHYHYYAFPLLVMLDLFMDGNCNADGYMDFDLMYLSELDPTWLNDELAFFTQPEAAAVANPLAISACTADAASSTLGKPID
ncbi:MULTISPECIES: TraU family protein, partial [Vibrio]